MTMRPNGFHWRPTGFFGRLLVLVLGACLLVLLLVLSLFVAAVGLVGLGLLLGYRWWTRRSIARTSREPLVIDVKPEPVPERSAERDRGGG